MKKYFTLVTFIFDSGGKLQTKYRQRTFKHELPIPSVKEWNKFCELDHELEADNWVIVNQFTMLI